MFLFGLAVKNKNTGGGGKWNATSWISLLKNRSSRFQEDTFASRRSKEERVLAFDEKGDWLLFEKKEKKRRNSLIIPAVRSLCES